MGATIAMGKKKKCPMPREGTRKGELCEKKSPRTIVRLFEGSAPDEIEVVCLRYMFLVGGLLASITKQYTLTAILLAYWLKLGEKSRQVKAT